MRIGLFFGSFNPIHTGHLIIGQYILEYTRLEKIWFVVSPQNPFKQRKSLAHEQDRIDMVRAAVYDNYDFQACDIEFSMPRPSYTVDTLAYLDDRHPDHDFSLIIGSDNLRHFHKWKNHEAILEEYQVIVYPRPGYEEIPEEYEHLHFVRAPLIDISATRIRRMISENKSVRYILPEEVQGFIRSKKLYLD